MQPKNVFQSKTNSLWEIKNWKSEIVEFVQWVAHNSGRLLRNILKLCFWVFGSHFLVEQWHFSLDLLLLSVFLGKSKSILILMGLPTFAWINCFIAILTIKSSVFGSVCQHASVQMKTISLLQKIHHVRVIPEDIYCHLGFSQVQSYIGRNIFYGQKEEEQRWCM